MDGQNATRGTEPVPNTRSDQDSVGPRVRIVKSQWPERPPAVSGRRLVLCCDGTGNEVSARAYSNVVKLYIRLDQHQPSKQLTYYDPGLGTIAPPGFRTKTVTSVARLAGLAFGYGLQDNIKDAYLFLMRHYQTGDRVYLFGFSRGAYTVRALAGLLHRCGLLRPGNENLVEHTVKRYFERINGQPGWKAMGRFKKYFGRKCPVQFIGVWDTVKSIGLLRRSLVLPHTADLKNVRSGRHAVSLDERRSKYRPNLWSRPDDACFQQVWFPGVHSDVGGGYDDSGLSDIALEWMLAEAAGAGVLFAPEPSKDLTPSPSTTLHNPLWPFWWVMGWRRRRIPAHDGTPVLVHHAALLRAHAEPRYAKTLHRQLPGLKSNQI